LLQLRKWEHYWLAPDVHTCTLMSLSFSNWPQPFFTA
jgi:hypothetical protein